MFNSDKSNVCCVCGRRTLRDKLRIHCSLSLHQYPTLNSYEAAKPEKRKLCFGKKCDLIVSRCGSLSLPNFLACKCH